MIKLHENGCFWRGGRPEEDGRGGRDAGRALTMSAGILAAHSRGDGGLHIKFDSLISHDITYVGIIETAKASGLSEFPVPYVMTNCHNSLCAVGGTINADDHVFGLSAAKKYGGIFVPPNMAVIHQYAREMMAKGGGMILGSDSHTRYGVLGCMGIGEGGPEIVKQLLGCTYDIEPPKTVLVYLTGAPARGVGPHDAAIALCGAVYGCGFVKNKIVEFAGPGVGKLPIDFRLGVDVMTTETACLSSVWETDGAVEEYYAVHGRAGDYKKLAPGEGAYYDSYIELDLSELEPMIALPFHPSKAHTIREFTANAGDLLRETEKDAAARFGGRAKLDLVSKVTPEGVRCDQGIIAGCAGGMYDNIAEAAAILRSGAGTGAFPLSVYPPSIPVALELMRGGVTEALTDAGAVFKPCFCGPCFGAGDVPANNGLSVRHVTRNFPNREGSKPAEGQAAAAALMDARSVAATALRGGIITPAADIDYVPPAPRAQAFDPAPYERRVYQGFGKADPAQKLVCGPNISEWPEIPALTDDVLIELASVIRDPVTTTDELIPSGDTSSYRSNPMKLASFALSRRDPCYVVRARKIKEDADALRCGKTPERIAGIFALVGADAGKCGLGSAIYAERPGDGSAREQAASCQRVLGGCANICREYATKRYRSNCINWGILPFTVGSGEFALEPGDFVYVPGVRKAVEDGAREIHAKAVSGGKVSDITLFLPQLTAEERRIIADGCLINWYAGGRKS